MGILDYFLAGPKPPMTPMAADLARMGGGQRGFGPVYEQPPVNTASIVGNLLKEYHPRLPEPRWQEMREDMVGAVSGYDPRTGQPVPHIARALTLAAPGGPGRGGTPLMGMVGAKAPMGPIAGSLADSAYRSRLHPALEAMPQEKMAAAQARGHLAKFPGGVGADEMEYTGIAKMLAEGGPVTKTGLLEQAQANPLVIEDVVKGGEPDSVRRLISQGRMEDAAEARALHTGEETKFSEWQMPGGEDYKEMLLTLPTKPLRPLPVPYKELPDNYTVISDITQTPDQRYGIIPDEQAHGRPLYGRHATPEAAQAEALTNLNAEQFRKIRDEDMSSYRGGHYDEPNVLAHARYNTRTIDGDKTLFVEEIQSDWHQAGRKKGYAPENVGGQIDELKTRREKIMRQIEGTRAESGWTPEYTAEQTKRRDGLFKEHEDVKNEIDALRNAREGVPDAPFKKNWHDLTMRRMIKEAADSGHDRIAWTPGQVQADRYDLSKQIDSVDWVPSTGEFFARKDGVHVISEKNVSKGDLENLVGKDAAAKLSADAAKRPGMDADKTTFHRIEGEDLKVGGEGMKTFYDKMMVKAANKYGKKFGAKVEVKKAATAKESELRRGIRENGYDPDDVNLQQILEDNGGRLPVWLSEAGANAIEKGRHLGDAVTPKAQEVWSMKITPEMATSAREGVLLGKTGTESRLAGAALNNQRQSQPMTIADLLRRGGT